MTFRTVLLPAFWGLLVLLLPTGCSENGFCQRGSGSLEIRRFDLATIDGLDLAERATVVLRQGDTQRVDIQTYPNVFDALETRVSDGLFVPRLDGCWNNEDLTIFLTIAQPLTQLSVSGVAEVQGETLIEAADQLSLDLSGSGRITLDLEATALRSDLSGAGDIVLMGTAQRQVVRISGSGDYQALDLIADDCGVSVSGSGQAEVYVNGRLEANLSGSGEVRYRGTPTAVHAEVSGSGEVTEG